MKVLEIIFTPNKITLANMNTDQIVDYIFSFHTPEERHQFQEDFVNCCNKGWIHLHSDREFHERNGIEPMTVNADSNTIILRFAIYNVEETCANLFDPPKVGVEPLRKKLEEDPTLGVYRMRLIDETEQDIFAQYDYTKRNTT